MYDIIDISRFQRETLSRILAKKSAEQLGLDRIAVEAYILHTAESPWQTKRYEMAKRAKKPATAAAAAPARNLLAEAVQATNTGQPLMITEAEMAALTNDQRGPLVEFNPTMRNGELVAFRATALGVQVHQSASAQPAQAGGWGSPQPTPPAPKGRARATQPAQAKAYTFETGIAIPAPRRGGRGSAVYGFEQMDVGVSFYIPSDNDNPNPAKRIASTVSSASKRLDPKKFVVRSVDETAQGRGKGARVWRTA